MMPVLAFHTAPNANSVAVVRAAKGTPWVKVCAPGDVARAKLAGAAKVYLRPYLPDDGDCTDGIAWAKEVGSAIAQAGGVWPDAIGFRNECSASVRTSAQYLRYRDALRSLGYRGLVVLGSFGVGQPATVAEWTALKNGLAGYAPDACELHEYWDLTVVGSSPWWALRHVEAIATGDLPASWPLFIGECGSDAIRNQGEPVEDSQGRAGWQDRGKLTPDQQIANLAAYRAGCAPSVVAAFVFVDGDTSGKWTNYATFDTPVETAIRATWQTPEIQTIDSGPTAVGGTTMVSLPIPLDNQLTSDGPNKYDECGPACVKMIADYLGLQPAETIDAIDTDETGDESLIGYTTTNQMVQWFTDRGVPAVQSQPQSTAAAIGANLARGWPCVYLGVWDRQAMTGGHFEVPISDDGAAITFNNPYGGIVEALSYADVDRYSLGWLVTIQAVKEMAIVADDPLTAAAKVRFSALGVQPNPDGALFKAYKRMVAVWLANGQDAVLDPTPAIKPEAVTPDGENAYLLLDSGRALHWRKDTGLVYQCEYKELPSVFKTAGWQQAA